jgi:adenosylhomocysteine nucleosidase
MTTRTPPRTKIVAGKKLFFVMATEHEFGPFLRRQIEPLITGVGPVEAAVATSAALGSMAAEGDIPDVVVTLGSAGSRSLEHANVYQVDRVSYRDMDATALGFDKGRTPFLDLPIEVQVEYRIPNIPTASISTGASIVTGDGYDGIGADMVDMESFAVLRAAEKFDVPMIGLRGISDGRSDVTGLSDWTEYLHVIDEKLASAVDRLSASLEDGSLILG